MYYYDVHVHTSETSKCGKVSGADQAMFYKSIGADGICITDHFLNGNTLVPTDLPWEDRVELFYKGYEAAKAVGDEIGLNVMCGWEYSYNRAIDFLTYGLDKEWLLRHPEVMDMGLIEYCDFVRSEGGVIIQAHPFRVDHRIDIMMLIPKNVDAVETLNITRPKFQIELADMYADGFGLTKICSSDNHRGSGQNIAMMGFEKRIHNMAELMHAMLHEEKEFKVLEAIEGE